MTNQTCGCKSDGTTTHHTPDCRERQRFGFFAALREGHGYTCPMLMGLTRLLTRRARWKKLGNGFWRVIVGIPGKTHGYEASCRFPRWMILAECRWWNSRAGLCVRKFFDWR